MNFVFDVIVKYIMTPLERRKSTMHRKIHNFLFTDETRVQPVRPLPRPFNTPRFDEPQTTHPPSKPLITSKSIPERIAVRETPKPILLLGGKAESAFWRFFEHETKSENTRQAYLIALYRFLDWCRDKGTPRELTADDIRAYLNQHQGSVSTVKQHLAAIRKVLDYLVNQGILASNPARDVKGPKAVNTQIKTPLLTPEQARAMLDSIDTSHLIGLRDRALISILLYSFARVSTAVALCVKDYTVRDEVAYLELPERSGKSTSVPLHPNARIYLEAYLEKAGIEVEPYSPLFRSSNRSRNRNQILAKPMTRKSVLKMLKRRICENGLPDNICAQSLRGTGIAAYLRGGGDIEIAARIAGHETVRSTQAYLREDVRVSISEIQRIDI
jgi:site-specific recombinase XerD